MAKRDNAQLKWKKKKWLEVLAPKLFNHMSLGETLAEEQDKVIGKVVQANMMNIARNPKLQSVTMRFKVTELKEGKANTEPISYVMAQSAIKRLVRSRRDRIDDSFVVMTKDEKKMRIKPLIITIANNTAQQRTGLRQFIRQHIASYAAEKTFEEIISDIIASNLQKQIKSQAKKIVPVRLVELRALAIDDRAKTVVAVQ